MATTMDKKEERFALAVERRMKGETCSYCMQPAEGNYSIHRDGFGEGPEVPLCDACGEGAWPTEEEIWSTIGQAERCIHCGEAIEPADERCGSFHSWCFNKESYRV